jgi:uncharacterized membrane protein (UPF0127 family)
MATRRLALIGLGLLLLTLAPVGCDKPTTGTSATNIESVQISGEWFELEHALDNDSRFMGLSGRTHIEPNGGMLFVFPRPSSLNFVMRDCMVDIDIIFLDGSGHITEMHHMPMEPPRDPVTEPLSPGGTSSPKYEARLTKYPSRFAAQFVIELDGGTLERLGLSKGDPIKLDVDGLKARAK